MFTFTPQFITYFFSIHSVPKEEAKAWSNAHDDVMLIKYADKKDVHLLSTLHPHTFKTVKGKRKPTTVVHYNTSMGGVDKSDQVTSILSSVSDKMGQN